MGGGGGGGGVGGGAPVAGVRAGCRVQSWWWAPGAVVGAEGAGCGRRGGGPNAVVDTRMCSLPTLSSLPHLALTQPTISPPAMPDPPQPSPSPLSKTLPHAHTKSKATALSTQRNTFGPPLSCPATIALPCSALRLPLCLRLGRQAGPLWVQLLKVLPPHGDEELVLSRTFFLDLGCLCKVDACVWVVQGYGGGAGVEEALHKRARWGVPRALRERDVIEVSSTTDNRTPTNRTPTGVRSGRRGGHHTCQPTMPAARLALPPT